MKAKDKSRQQMIDAIREIYGLKPLYKKRLTNYHSGVYFLSSFGMVEGCLKAPIHFRPDYPADQDNE